MITEAYLIKASNDFLLVLCTMADFCFLFRTENEAKIFKNFLALSFTTSSSAIFQKLKLKTNKAIYV